MSCAACNRLLAIAGKELRQLRRDRPTLTMLLGIPLLQILLFGFAINLAPKDLSALVVAESNPFYAQRAVRALRESGYFSRVERRESATQALRALREGEVQAVVNIASPPFGLEKPGARTTIRVSLDDSDPLLGGTLVHALEQVIRRRQELQHTPAAATAPVTVTLERLYNPDGITAYHILPGLLGVILTMTLVMMSALTFVREKDNGTLETLIASPGRPLEFLLGKLMPYGLVGLAQAAFLLFLAGTVFQIPFRGPLHLLVLPVCLFISANLLLGAIFSTLARNQTQAMQMTFFFFLPSTLLSGFMFPFVGMPRWAQALGEALPLTHFLRIVRGVLLKGFTAPEIVPHLWPIALFCVAAAALSVICFRETLD